MSCLFHPHVWDADPKESTENCLGSLCNLNQKVRWRKESKCWGVRGTDIIV